MKCKISMTQASDLLVNMFFNFPKEGLMSPFLHVADKEAQRC